jgi:hypothetical protein
MRTRRRIMKEDKKRVLVLRKVSWIKEHTPGCKMGKKSLIMSPGHLFSELTKLRNLN